VPSKQAHSIAPQTIAFDVAVIGFDRGAVLFQPAVLFFLFDDIRPVC